MNYFGNVKGRLEVMDIHFASIEKTGSIEHNTAIRHVLKSWSKFYGLNNRYDGSGNKRSVGDFQRLVKHIEFPEDWN